jgi:hypothetical protein
VTNERLADRNASLSPDGLNLYGGGRNGSVYVFATFGCTPLAAAGCQPPAASRQSALAIKNSLPTSDELIWRTTPAGVTDVADFCDPVAGDDHVVVCLYDASGNPQPLAEVVGPARGTCSLEPCWEAASSGTRLKFADRTGLPGGSRS